MAEPVFGNVTFTSLYDAGLNTIPTDQGWTRTGSFTTESASGGWLRLTSTGGAPGAYYSKAGAMPAVQSGRVLVNHLRARLESGHQYSTLIDWGVNGLAASQADYDRVFIRGSWTSWGVNRYSIGSYNGSTSISSETNILSGLPVFDLLDLWALAGLNSAQLTHLVLFREAGAYSVDSLAGYRVLQRACSYSNQNTNICRFGDLWDQLGQDWSVSLIRSGWTDGPQILSANGVPLFGAQGDEPRVLITVSPSTIGHGETADATATFEGDALASLNGSAWDGSAETVATGSEPLPTATVTADSGNTTTIQNGDPVTIAWATTNAVSVTLNGSAVAASGNRVYDGTTYPLLTTDTVFDLVVTADQGTVRDECVVFVNPTFAQQTAPGQPPTPAWVGGALTIYPASAGYGTRTYYRLLLWDVTTGKLADDPATTDASYPTMFGAGQTSSTAHGWGAALDPDALYAVVIIDDHGRQSLPSGLFWGSPDNEAVCAVTFNGHTDLAGKVVKAVPSVPFRVGDIVFAYSVSVTLDANGDGVVNLGRSDAGTALTGTAAPHWVFVVNGKAIPREVPDAATADFSNLVAPA